MKKFGRLIFVLIVFIPILWIDGWKKTWSDAIEYIKKD